jgi:[glutamine synthetase] adenylyltransferase / [glutamine synthetase]-adenylyl-L-tyrosine phosphorylase
VFTAAQLASFHDVQRARRDLEQLRSRLPSELISSLLALLPECADPDQALNLFERLTAIGDAELIALLERNHVLLHYILAIFGQSYWLGETILRDPAIAYGLKPKDLEHPLGHEKFRRNFEAFRSRCAHGDVAALLAAFKKQEYVRIALRDILGIATLAETTEELSALADVILQYALHKAESQMQAQFGDPPPGAAHDTAHRFCVLSLGKLGGNELNYSSDLDLLYLYGDCDSCNGVSAREYFTRQAQILTDILCRSSEEGPVFRIDLRLRPQGAEGELTIGLRQALEYYTHTAHDWELQALIKLRHSAGDQALSREFIKGVQPRVFTENINFAALDTALRSRQRIDSRRHGGLLQSRHSGSVDVKLDRGGIRDIEFLVQCLQRVYGGEEKWLRSGGTLFSLQKLHDKGHISGKNFHELTHAYEFFRRVEHRLQLQRGRQVHRFPSEHQALAALQRAVLPDSEQPGDFQSTVAAYMRQVQDIYSRVVFSQRRREKQARETARTPSGSSAHEMSFDEMLERIAHDSDVLYEIAARPLASHTRRNLQRFFASAMTSAERYAALLEDPAAVEKAVPLLASSDYLSDILARHPDVVRALDVMSDEAGKPLPHWPEELLSQSSARLDSRQSLNALRQSFRKFSFCIGAQDILAPRPVFESLRQNSALADAAIRMALHISNGEETLAVFALGRLGTEEFDIGSDADLLFVRAPDTDDDLARNRAEALVHALAAYTREGSLFALDARLRPHGNEGELVVTPARLERYLADEAQPWEALSYTKLRFVAGRQDVAGTMLPLVWHRIVESAFRPGFTEAVTEMRARLEKSNRYPRSFKLARGGFYDIDFMVSFLMLRAASLQSGNTLERLEQLQAAGILQSSTFELLRDAALLYRTTDHAIRLVTGRARPELPAAEHARQTVVKLVPEILKCPTDDLQAELNLSAHRVRSLFEGLVKA